MCTSRHLILNKVEQVNIHILRDVPPKLSRKIRVFTYLTLYKFMDLLVHTKVIRRHRCKLKSS